MRGAPVPDLQLSLGQLHINHLQNVAEVLFEDIGSEQSGMSLLNEFKACSLIVGQVFRSLARVYCEPFTVLAILRVSFADSSCSGDFS